MELSLLALLGLHLLVGAKFQGAKVPRSEESRERKFQGAKVPHLDFSLPRPFAPGSESSMYGTFAPWITEQAATGVSAVSTAVWSGPSVSPPAGRRRCLSVMFIDLSVYNSTSPLGCSRVSRSISRGVTLISAAAI